MWISKSPKNLNPLNGPVHGGATLTAFLRQAVGVDDADLVASHGPQGTPGMDMATIAEKLDDGTSSPSSAAPAPTAVSRDEHQRDIAQRCADLNQSSEADESPAAAPDRGIEVDLSPKVALRKRQKTGKDAPISKASGILTTAA
jgi:hypothetical protein